jgi:type I restriction enzyme S subunit
VSNPITDGPHETPTFLEDGVPFVSAEAVATGVIDFSKIRAFISEEDHLRFSQKYRPQRGDIYMVKSGATTGVTAIVDTDVEFNIWSPLAAIRCRAQAMPRFVLNFMRSKNFQNAVTLNWSFGTQQNIGMGVIENLAVALPTTAEQSKIVTFLDHETAKVAALIAEQQRLIGLLKEKRQSVVTRVVTKGLNPSVPMKESGIEWFGDVPQHWSIKRLGSVSDVIQTGPFGSQLHSEDYVEDGTPVINPSNIQDGRIIPNWSCTVGHDVVERLSQHKLEVGDIVFARRGEMGRCAKVSGKEAGWLCGTGSLNVRLNRSMVVEFVSTYLGTLYVCDLLKLESVGSTMDNLNTTILSRVPVPVPPLGEQSMIAAFLDRETAKLDALTAEAQSAIALLQERCTALISAAVTGKIDVRGLTGVHTEEEAAE